uniref:Fatty acid desaturase domain-containing protein n=1 Tax=Arcella intermedia TaxID=1963864 RepID=A0A6B2L979_9EUKA
MPEDLAEVMKVMPKDAMQVDLPFAFFTTARVWAFCVFSTYLVYISPWYLLPLSWVFMGTCITGLFVVAHDCAHQSFSKSRLLNEIVGTVCMMPLAFPYNCWEITHNHHHETANNLDRDHLWRPLKRADVEKMSPFMRSLNYYMFGPLFFESSILHHAYHFLIPFVSSKNRAGALRSIVFALIGAVASWKLASSFGNPLVLYGVPFLVFQFWLSTFTYFHHRHPRGVGWKEHKDWTKLYGSLFATVHVDYPAWVEYLTLDINWHLPHHVSPRIPWYNLRRCTYSLFIAYGDKLQRDEFGWRLWQETTTGCHVYDKELGYVPMYINQSDAKE